MLFYVVLNGFEYFMNLNNTNMLNICFQNLQKMINIFLQFVFPNTKIPTEKQRKTAKRCYLKVSKSF